MSEKVLVAGNNVRNVAQSARKAGYKVYAITKFADSDLAIYCEDILRIDDTLSEDELAKIVRSEAEKLNAKIVLCSGFETLRVEGELLCNSPKSCEKVVNKLNFYRELEKAGLPFPELLSEDDIEVGILKPVKGGGGEGVTISSSPESKKGYIRQKYIKGLPCSVSLIASEGRSVAIACNLIFAGWNEMYASGFRYAGNLTPLNAGKEVRSELEKLAIEAIGLFDLKGSVGVDLILADKPYILEINPRFQGSLDSVEWSCNVNVFKMHVRAFEGKLPEKCRYERFAARAVLFAPYSIRIKSDLSGNPFFADIPVKGSVYRKGDPLASILASGSSAEEVTQKILERRDIFLKLQS